MMVLRTIVKLVCFVSMSTSVCESVEHVSDGNAQRIVTFVRNLLAILMRMIIIYSQHLTRL